MCFIKQLSLNRVCKELVSLRHSGRWLADITSCFTYFLVPTCCSSAKRIFPGFGKLVQAKCSPPVTQWKVMCERLWSVSLAIIFWEVTEGRARDLWMHTFSLMYVLVSIPHMLSFHLYIVSIESWVRGKNDSRLRMKQLTSAHWGGGAGKCEPLKEVK